MENWTLKEPISVGPSTIQSSIVFRNLETGRTIITILPNGSVELGDGIANDESAREFWKAVEKLSPQMSLRNQANADSADARDAARYRWLRDRNLPRAGIPAIYSFDVDGGEWQLEGKRADDEIDEMMAREAK